ncbi:MAG: GNAT family N-acetyltransferase [candidate division Zixibacteria bacterium]|nr:GNAT family N-acetyltransferase [candidate division Zixibacteria bacterium]
MTEHLIREDYRDNETLREAYYAFIQTVFPGVNFRNWHDRGYWPAEYIPYSLVNGSHIISNVSVYKMTVLVSGQPIRAAQIGAVGTLPDYREQGLSRHLMEYVIDKYRTEVDLLFLFANETVIDFYPKFGFAKHLESVFIATSDIPTPHYAVRKLDINRSSDMALIAYRLKKRNDLTSLFGARDYAGVTLWHILNIHSERVLYDEEDGIIFIASEKDTILHVWDIIFTRPFKPETVLPKIIKSDAITSIRYYFSPEVTGFSYDKTESIDDSPLYTLGDFSIDGVPFKFPATAQT